MIRRLSRRDSMGHMIPYYSMAEAGLVGGQTPADIPGLSRWVKAGSLTGLSDGDTVNTLTDLSGNGKHLNGSGVYRPSVSDINNKAAIEFGGSTNFTGDGLFAGSAARTMYVVYKSRAVGSFSNEVAGQYEYTGTNSPGEWFSIQCRTVSVTGDPYFSGYAADITGPSPDNMWKSATATYDGTDVSLYKNGVLIDTAALAISTPFDFILGGSLSSYLDGYVAEMAEFDSALTGPQLDIINLYLTREYGL